MSFIIWTLVSILALILVALATRLAWCLASEPDFKIGEPGSYYMLRWWVIPRNRKFNIYLHHMLRDDDDRALHDHPWRNLSIVLRGGYFEIAPKYRPVHEPYRLAVSPDEYQPANCAEKWRGPGSFVLRRAEDAHRVRLKYGKTSWSLFITGPVIRKWGFWCPKGWRRWEDFVSITPGGNATGKGCGGLE